MSFAANAPEAARSGEPLAARYEALIRLAEAIRSQRNWRDLFQAFAKELREVVPFDAIGQFDGTTLVHWHYVEPHDQQIEALRQSGLPQDEETPERWVYRHQQPSSSAPATGRPAFLFSIVSGRRASGRSVCCR